jgi:cob(I)alamin adenosyltransferase
MPKIYTKTGDTGETSLYGGQRVAKGNPRLEAYGTVDETNTALGLALAQTGGENYAEQIKKLQIDLMIVGSELATPTGQTIAGLDLISDERIGELEKDIDVMEAELPALTNFILPGGNQVGANLHHARTISRRAERAVVRLAESELVRPQVIKYLNRLSDYLFVLARHANAKLPGGSEQVWAGRKQ